MLNKIFGLAIILYSMLQPVQVILSNSHRNEHNFGKRSFDERKALLDFMNKREGLKGYHWDECEFSPLSCLLRR